ncbi:DUF1028 domain-containing protein [Desulfonatronum parangueonense]
MTLSIVAHCPRTGQFGVAAATAMPAVGKLLTHAAPRIGAIATHARINPYLGIDGLVLLRRRLAALDVSELLRRSDPLIQTRQFAVLDMAGRAVAFTGTECPAWAGHREDEGFSVQGNRLAGAQVVDAAVESLQKTGNLEELDLAARLVAALEASEAAGGDVKGEDSATIYVVDTEEYPLWDIRVDLHDDPVAELRRLHDIFRERLLEKILAMPTRRHPAGML